MLYFLQIFQAGFINKSNAAAISEFILNQANTVCFLSPGNQRVFSISRGSPRPLPRRPGIAASVRNAPSPTLATAERLAERGCK